MDCPECLRQDALRYREFEGRSEEGETIEFKIWECVGCHMVFTVEDLQSVLR